MRNAYIAGVGVTATGKFLNKTLKELSTVAFWNALRDADISPKQIEMVYFANSLGGLLTGQESVRGQTVMNDIGLRGIPVVNVENACASSSTALFGCWMAVASGFCDVALALGAEKLYCDDTKRTTAALATCTDIDLEGGSGFFFPGEYAMRAKRHMAKYGTTREQLAKVAVKNHRNGCLNPYAQYQKEVTIEEVLNSRMIADPITLYMTCPIGDGAAAAIVCSDKVSRKSMSRRIGVDAVSLAAGTIRDAQNEDTPDLVERCSTIAYEGAGVGAKDIDVAELHDASVISELMWIESLGFCQRGESGRMMDEGRTELGGDIPINTSGGLMSRGHPIGATGLLQTAEIVWQLRGEAGKRQVPNPKVGLVQNGGGYISGEGAAMAVKILTK